MGRQKSRSTCRRGERLWSCKVDEWWWATARGSISMSLWISAFLPTLRDVSNLPRTVGLLNKNCGTIKGIGFASKAFRVTAIFMVLFASVELFACDLFPTSDCYISSGLQNHVSGQAQVTDGCDNCLCFCAHVVVVRPVVLIPQQAIASTDTGMVVERPLFSPAAIDPPPQLS